MIDYEKLDKLMELPVSEEILGAYIEGNLSDVEPGTIESILNDSECRAIVSEINARETDQEDAKEYPDLDAIELPGDEEYIMEVDSDDIIKHFTVMREILLKSLGDAAESCGSVGAHMSVGEEAVDVTSSHVLQSYRDTCAIKSQQLILEKFGKHLTEDELVQQAYDNGWYRPGCGTSGNDMGEILRANGVPCTNYSNCNMAHVVSALADGKQVMMAVDSGELWETSFIGKLKEAIEDKIPFVGGADHALLVTGIDASDPSDVKVIVTDPGSGALNKPYPLKQFIDAAEDSKFYMTVTDNPAPNVFDAFEPDTTHLPMIGDMNYYEFINQFSDYMQDGDVIPDSVWNDFKLSAFGGDEADAIPDETVIFGGNNEPAGSDEPVGGDSPTSGDDPEYYDDEDDPEGDDSTTSGDDPEYDDDDDDPENDEDEDGDDDDDEYDEA